MQYETNSTPQRDNETKTYMISCAYFYLQTVVRLLPITTALSLLVDVPFAVSTAKGRYSMYCTGPPEGLH